MSFRSPAILALLIVLVPLALVLVGYAARRRREALSLFLGPRGDAEASGLAFIARRRKTRSVLSVAAIACVGVALAGPRIGTATREARQESLDLMIALDVSESMRVEDVAPSRLERSRLEIERILDERRGDRVGLVVFAGEAFLQCPLTTDRSAVKLFLSAVDPDQIAIQGTDVGRALAVAEQAFDAAEDGAGKDRPRALLVVSDGENHEGGLSTAADALRDDGVTLMALGVGTEEGGPVPEFIRGEPRGVKRDREGNVVISTFQEGTLSAIAGRAETFRVGRSGSAAPQIIDALSRLNRAVLSEQTFSASAERFQWPLAIGALLLLLERLLSARRSPSTSTQTPQG